MLTPISIKAEIKRLYDIGFGVHILKPKSKVPLNSGWSGDNRDLLSSLYKDLKPNNNIGTKLGTPSMIETDYDGEGYLAVIDVDVKGTGEKYQNQARAKINEMFPGLLDSAPITMSGRGNGSMHIWCLTATPIDSCALFASNEMVEVFMPSAKPTEKQIEVLGKQKVSEGWRLRPSFEIDFMSKGRQVVLPPSIHPDTNKKYKWFRELNSPNDLQFLDIKKFLETFQVQKKTQSGRPSGGSVDMIKPIDVSEMELELRLKQTVVDNIVSGEDVNDRSAMLLSVAMSMIHAKFSDGEIVGVLTCREFFLGAVAYEHVQSSNRMKASRWVQRYVLEPAHREINSSGDFESEVEVYETLSEETAQEQKETLVDSVNPKVIDDVDSWKFELDRTDKGNLKVTFKNVVLILENVIGENLFEFDEFSKQIFYGCNTPWGNKPNEVLSNIDSILVLDWFANSDWGIEPNENMIDKAIRNIAHKNLFHPVRDYLTSLVWDGKPRIKTWLKDFLSAEGDDQYLELISEIFLVACVARVFDPGIKYEYMMILEGEQGVGKSTVGKILAGEPWFFDSPLDLHDKDSSLNLQGQWIVEMGELANLRKADVTTIKSFISRSTDKFRPPFEKSTASFARQCVFFGTTNDHAYLKDPTGNRRFFPVNVGEIDLNGLTEARDQLWAEALNSYDMGTKIYLSSEDQKNIASIAQNEKVVEDTQSIMTDLIFSWKEQVIKSAKTNNKDLSKFSFKLVDLFEDQMFPGEDDEHIKSPLINFKSDNNYNLQLAGISLIKNSFERKKTTKGNKWQFKDFDRFKK